MSASGILSARALLGLLTSPLAMSGLLVLAALLLVHGSWGALVLNELLPDPEGSDAGREFVELLNTGPVTVSLAGVTLEFGNGAEVASWLKRWTGGEGQFLAAGGRFLITDRNWLGPEPADAEVYLGLQNGPDALRLVRDGAVLDLVGYGRLTDPTMMETAPAAVAAGKALARKPDGRDTQDNSRDFHLAVPTPGRANFLPYDFAITTWELEPPSADRSGLRFHLTLAVRNTGTEALPSGEIYLVVGAERFAVLLDRTPPDDLRTLTWNFRPRVAGHLSLGLEMPLDATGGVLVREWTHLQVGPPGLVLNEVMAAPASGQGEWIELAAVGPEVVDLGRYQLRDQDGAWRPVGAGSLWPGEFLVLAQDSLGLAGWHDENRNRGAPGDCPGSGELPGLHALAGWPSLNNSAPADRDFADRILLGNANGDVLDHVTLGGSNHLIGGEAPAGVALERMSPNATNPGASNWGPSTSLTGGTPGCPNSLTPGTAFSGGFSADPRVLDRLSGATAMHLRFDLAPGNDGWELRIYALDGALVKDFGGDRRGPGPRHLVWDGTDDRGRPALPGAYVCLLETRDETGRRSGSTKMLVGVR